MILLAATRLLLPLFLVYSIYLLFDGHNGPGGGFTGGLVAAAGFSLFGMSHGPVVARRILRIKPNVLIGTGLLISLAAASLPVFQGKKFFTAIWTISGLGTPVLFDVGVYILVFGMANYIIQALSEAE